jgi:hypothetical protein
VASPDLDRRPARWPVNSGPVSADSQGITEVLKPWMKRPAAFLIWLACAGACVDLTRPALEGVVPLGDGSANDGRGELGPPPDTDSSSETGGSGGAGEGGAGGSDTDGGTMGDLAPGEEVGVGLDTANPQPEVAPPIDVPNNPPNQAPTVSVAAGANMAPVTGTTAVLSALGADDQGEPALVYTWATIGTAPGPVGFSINGVNAAKSVTATFTKAGSYTFEVAIRDGAGLAVTSVLSIVVAQTPNDIAISPTMATLPAGGTQQFTAKVFDQFGVPLTAAVAPTWSLIGTCGTLSSNGFLTAASGVAATCSVKASAGAASDVAAVVVGAATLIIAPNADTYVEESNENRNFGSDATLQSKVQDGVENTRHAYLRFSLPAMSFSKATLALYGRSAASTTREGVVAVADNNWSESGMTWKNRPALGTTRAIVDVTTTAKYREWDVTNLVFEALANGHNQVTFALRMEQPTSNSPDWFSSREAGSNPPALVLSP